MVIPRDESARARFANELDRNFSVVASAGSGKTTAITQRVLSIARSPMMRMLPGASRWNISSTYDDVNTTLAA